MASRKPLADERNPGDRGLLLPRTTQIPDVILDVWAPRLTEAQLRVVLYVARRTYGWRKEADRISLDQFTGAIMSRKKGTHTDHGTGLSRQAVIAACRHLEAAGLLRVERRHGRNGRSAPSVFSLNLECPFPDALERLARAHRRARKARERGATARRTQVGSASAAADESGGATAADLGVPPREEAITAPPPFKMEGPPALSAEGRVHPVDPPAGTEQFTALTHNTQPYQHTTTTTNRGVVVVDDPGGPIPEGERLPLDRVVVVERNERPAEPTEEEEAAWQALRARLSRFRRPRD